MVPRQNLTPCRLSTKKLACVDLPVLLQVGLHQILEVRNHKALSSLYLHVMQAAELKFYVVFVYLNGLLTHNTPHDDTIMTLYYCASLFPSPPYVWVWHVLVIRQSTSLPSILQGEGLCQSYIPEHRKQGSILSFLQYILSTNHCWLC